MNRPNFADRIVQICLASISGFSMTTPPSRERLYGVQWPCLIEKRLVTPIVRIEGSADVTVPWGVTGEHEGEGVDTPAQYAWLTGYLTIEKLAELMPEVRGLRLERFEFPNLRGLNFLIYGYLEDGVSSCLRVDAQAKGLGEYLASKTVEVPRSVLRVAS